MFSDNLKTMESIVNISLFLWLSVLLNPFNVQGSILKIDKEKIYTRMTVQISENVPRQLCKATLDNLEVRTRYKLTLHIFSYQPGAIPIKLFKPPAGVK